MRIRIALAKRLEKYKLKVNEEKTKVVNFSKSKSSQNVKQETSNFLDFMFYLGKSRKSKIILKVKSCSRRISSKLKRVND